MLSRRESAYFYLNRTLYVDTMSISCVYLRHSAKVQCPTWAMRLPCRSTNDDELLLMWRWRTRKQQNLRTVEPSYRNYICYDTEELIQVIATVTNPRTIAIAIITTPYPTSNVGNATAEFDRDGFISTPFGPIDRLGGSVLS